MSDFESELHFAQASWDDHDADYEADDDMPDKEDAICSSFL